MQHKSPSNTEQQPQPQSTAADTGNTRPADTAAAATAAGTDTKNSSAQPADKAQSTAQAPARKPQPKSRLLRAGAITAGATFLSRILGMVRDIAIAQLLGAGLAADVFFFANRIPNFFRRLFAEGAFAQAFVPVLSQYKKEGNQQELRKLVGATAGTLGLVVLLVCVIGMIAAPAVTMLFGFGWFQAWLNDAPDGFKFTQASFLLQITFPYLFFITLTALCSSLLNVFGKFAVPAVTPCILNIVMIAAAYFVAPHTSFDPNTVLACAMVTGGVLQLVFVLPAVMRLKLLVLPRFAWRHPGVSKIRQLMLPGLVGVSASQINLLVNTVLASFLGTGAISYLYYSDRLLEFPIGIFAVAISTVILPALSRSDLQTQAEQYRRTLDWGVRLVLLLGIPSACGLIALREGVLRVIFMRGAFTAEHVSLSSASLLASVSGLAAIMLVRVLIQGFAALQDTKTPVRCTIIAIMANIVFNLILVWPLDYVGLALSTALAAFVNAGQLLYLLHKRDIYRLSKDTLLFVLKVLVSGVVMAAAVRYFEPTLEQWVSFDTLTAIAYLAACIAGGAVLFAVMVLLLGIRPSVLRR